MKQRVSKGGPQCDISDFLDFSEFACSRHRTRTRNTSRSASELGLSPLFITDPLRSAPMATMDITLMRARLTAITALTGLRMACSSALVHGSTAFMGVHTVFTAAATTDAVTTADAPTMDGVATTVAGFAAVPMSFMVEAGFAAVRSVAVAASTVEATGADKFFPRSEPNGW